MLDSNASVPGVLVVSRFRVPSDQVDAFGDMARRAIEVLGACNGFIDGAIGQSTDDLELRTIATRWTNIGAYRRSLSSFDVRVTAIPLLSTAIDEPSSYELVHVRTTEGIVEAPSGLAADSEGTRLGQAAGPDIPGVRT